MFDVLVFNFFDKYIFNLKLMLFNFNLKMSINVHIVEE